MSGGDGNTISDLIQIRQSSVVVTWRKTRRNVYENECLEFKTLNSWLTM